MSSCYTYHCSANARQSIGIMFYFQPIYSDDDCRRHRSSSFSGIGNSRSFSLESSRPVLPEEHRGGTIKTAFRFECKSARNTWYENNLEVPLSCIIISPLKSVGYRMYFRRLFTYLRSSARRGSYVKMHVRNVFEPASQHNNNNNNNNCLHHFLGSDTEYMSLTSSMRYNGAGRTAWVARLSASPTSATCPPLREPGLLQGLAGSGLTWTARPSLKSRVLSRWEGVKGRG